MVKKLLKHIDDFYYDHYEIFDSIIDWFKSIGVMFGILFACIMVPVSLIFIPNLCGLESKD